MKDHSSEKIFSTKRYVPWKLLYYEAYLLEKSARIREQKLKHHGNALRQIKRRIDVGGNSAGFTLIEILASVIVLAAIGSIITGIVASSLRGASKTNTIENVRQNGNYALNQMSKDIEYALPFDGKNTGLSNDGGVTYATSCPTLPSSPTPTTVITPYGLIAVELASGAVNKYECFVPSPPDIATLSVNSASLIDVNSISLKSCSFACIQTNVMDVPIIKISFTLEPKSSNSLVENISPPVTFETSVIPRNYKR